GYDSEDITVRAPLAATITEASRYIESGEVQYLFTFLNECGIMYRFDHLYTLSEKLQRVADTLPEAKPDDSRTTPISGVTVEQGEIIATAVGLKVNKNTSVDFGVYDLRSRNAISTSNSEWTQLHA